MDDASRKKKTGWGKAAKVSLGILGGLSLVMGYISATGVKVSEREAAARKAIDDFIAALNAHDQEACRKMLHYPNIQIEGGDVRICSGPEDFDIDIDSHLAAGRWQYLLDACVVRHTSKDLVHFEVRFSRHGSGGGGKSTYQSLWVLTKKDGIWGIQSRSSIEI